MILAQKSNDENESCCSVPLVSFRFFFHSPKPVSHLLIGESRRLCHGKGVVVVERVPSICIGGPIIRVGIRDRRCKARIALIEGRKSVH